MTELLEKTPVEVVLDATRIASVALVEAELNVQSKYNALAEAVRQANRSGVSVDALSEATGCRPQTVREMIQAPIEIGDFDTLAGLR